MTKLAVLFLILFSGQALALDVAYVWPNGEPVVDGLVTLTNSSIILKTDAEGKISFIPALTQYKITIFTKELDWPVDYWISEIDPKWTTGYTFTVWTAYMERPPLPPGGSNSLRGGQQNVINERAEENINSGGCFISCLKTKTQRK